MTEAEVYGKLALIFHDVFDRDDLRLHAHLSAPDVAGWDSMKQIDILLAIEQEFSIKFSSREIDSFQNVGDLVAGILAKGLS